MGHGLYKTNDEDFDRTKDLTQLKPYGDTMNDGKVQLSFTLPIPDNEKAVEAARLYAHKMGLKEPDVVHHQALDSDFTFFVVYGSSQHMIDYTSIKVQALEIETMGMKETDEYIRTYINRPIVIVGATTGTDAHTVGIDAIMNMKGYAGHYGLERYEMIEAHNLGAQVPNETLVKRALELNADVILVSQTVTQKKVHIHNLTQLVELMEAEGLRDKFLLVCGGPRITNDLAKELGYDAGFGPGKYADDVATFAVKWIKERM